jgi:hypothetical protein
MPRLSDLIAAALLCLMSAGVGYSVGTDTDTDTAPLLPVAGDSLRWGEGGTCWIIDAVQPSSDGEAWVWMHRCEAPADKPTPLPVAEWRAWAQPLDYLRGP